MIKNFINCEGHQNAISCSKGMAILRKGGFNLLVELHQDIPRNSVIVLKWREIDVDYLHHLIGVQAEV